MHDIKWIRDNPAAFDRGLTRREPEAAGAAQRLIALDEARRAAITAAETAQARRNAASKEIGEAKKAKDEATRRRADGRGRRAEGRRMPALEAEAKAADAALQTALARSPEPAARRGAGRHGRARQCRASHASAPKRDYAFTPKQHFELGEALGHDGFRAGGANCPARASSC